MKLKKIIIKILAMLLVGWFWFGWAIPHANFSLWMLSADDVKNVMVMGFLLAVIFEIGGVSIFKRKTKHKTSPSFNSKSIKT